MCGCVRHYACLWASGDTAWRAQPAASRSVAVPFSALHSRTVWSCAPLASHDPSGETARPTTQSTWFFEAHSKQPVESECTRTWSSRPPLASHEPLHGSKQSDATLSVCACISCFTLPSPRDDQTSTFPSLPPLATHWPLGAIASAVTGTVCPANENIVDPCGHCHRRTVAS